MRGLLTAALLFSFTAESGFASNAERDNWLVSTYREGCHKELKKEGLSVSNKARALKHFNYWAETHLKNIRSLFKLPGYDKGYEQKRKEFHNHCVEIYERDLY